MTTKPTTTPTTPGTSIFREAVLEATDLRARAVQDAQNAVLEALGPQIRQYVDKELINGFGKQNGFLILEQDEAGLPDASVDVPVPSTPDAGTTPPPPPSAAGDAPPTLSPGPEASATDVAGDSGTPIAAAGDAIPVPGPDGKITVDLDSLFVAADDDDSGALDVPTDGSEPPASTEPAPELAPAGTTVDLPVSPTGDVPATPEVPAPPSAEPAPAPGGETPPASPTDNAQPLAETIPTDRKPEEEKLTITFESFDSALGLAEKSMEAETAVISEGKLLRMYEVLKENKDSWKLDDTVFTLVSDRIEILLEKVDQTANSYTSKGKQSMTTRTLKDFARSLLEDASAGFGDGAGVKPGVKNNNESGKPSTHAMKASDPEVKDPGKKDALKVPGKPVSGSDLSEDASAGAGEMGTAEKELMEMIGGMEDAKPGSSGSAVRVAPQGSGPVGEPDKKSILERKIAALREEQEKLMNELQECGPEMGGAGEGVNVNITIDAPGASVGGSDPVASADLDGGMGGLSGLSDDDEIELVDDGDDAEVAVGGSDAGSDAGAGDDDVDVAGGLPGGDSGSDAGDDEDASDTTKMLAENRELKTQLAETQLLTARSLYVNKLFAAHDLSGKLKHGIVKYLDSARTIEEAKAAYGKVKTQLNESAKKKAAAQAGNSGASVSATNPSTINEGAVPQQATGLGAIGLGTAARWQQLAGIKV